MAISWTEAVACEAISFEQLALAPVARGNASRSWAAASASQQRTQAKLPEAGTKGAWQSDEAASAMAKGASTNLCLQIR